MKFLKSQRPYSIRTRIKTWKRAVISYHLNVRDHIPLEQGLRRLTIQRVKTVGSSQRPYSIRTRIKT